jgi:hypothetical protein
MNKNLAMCPDSGSDKGDPAANCGSDNGLMAFIAESIIREFSMK